MKKKTPRFDACHLLIVIYILAYIIAYFIWIGAIKWFDSAMMINRQEIGGMAILLLMIAFSIHYIHRALLILANHFHKYLNH